MIRIPGNRARPPTIAYRCKHNTVTLYLVNHLGGHAPDAAKFLHTLKQRAARHGCDRNAYEDGGPTKRMPRWTPGPNASPPPSSRATHAAASSASTASRGMPPAPPRAADPGARAPPPPPPPPPASKSAAQVRGA